MKEEKIKISVNQEDVQNIINCYEKDIERIKQLEEVIKEARKKLKSYITFCENDSQGVHEICNMAIRKYKNIDEILSKGENK